MKRKHAIAPLIVLIALTLAAVPAAQAQAVPKYKVGPAWPKELTGHTACLMTR